MLILTGLKLDSGSNRYAQLHTSFLFALTYFVGTLQEYHQWQQTTRITCNRKKRVTILTEGRHDVRRLETAILSLLISQTPALQDCVRESSCGRSYSTLLLSDRLHARTHSLSLSLTHTHTHTHTLTHTHTITTATTVLILFHKTSDFNICYLSLVGCSARTGINSRMDYLTTKHVA
jgi:hypothetical protein